MMVEYLTLTLLLASLVLLSITLWLLRKTLSYYRGVKMLVESRLRPLKKIRKRYIVFTALCEDKTRLEDLELAIRETMIKYYGESIYGKASPQIVFYDETGSRGVIRVVHVYTVYLIATLGLIKKVGNTNCLLIPVRTSGTLKKAKEYMYKSKI